MKRSKKNAAACEEQQRMEQPIELPLREKIGLACWIAIVFKLTDIFQIIGKMLWLVLKAWVLER